MKKRYTTIALAAAVIMNTFGVSYQTAFAKTLLQKTLDFEKSAVEAGFITTDYSDYLAEEADNHALNVNNKANEIKLEFADSENGKKTVLADGETISVMFDVKFESAALSAASVVPIFTDSDGNIIENELCVFRILAGKLNLTGSNTENNIQLIGKKDTYYNVEYIIDKAAKTYKVKVDGEEKFAGALDNSPETVGGLDSITIKGEKSKNVTFDNIVITISDSSNDPDKPTDPTDPTDPGETEEPEEDSELFCNYNFEKDTVGKAPAGDGITCAVKNKSVSVDDYFKVVEHEGLDGKTSKMLRIKHDGSLTYADFNFIKFMFSENAESPILEYSYDVMAIAEDHVAAGLGMFDYYYDGNKNIVNMSMWGLPTFGMTGRYMQNWYTNIKDGSAPQFTAGKGVWTNIRIIVNTVTNTMSMYHDGLEVPNGINVKPARFDTSSEADRNIDGWSGFQIYGGRNDKTDFEFYYDNIKIYKREPVIFTAQQSENDISTAGAELTFKANRDIASMSEPVIKDSKGNNISPKNYIIKKDSEGFTVSFNNGVLNKKSKYTINVESAYDSNQIGLADKFMYEFTTEPENYDVTCKVMNGEDKVESLSGLGGQTVNIYAKNRNYKTEKEKEFITFAVLTDSKGKMIAIKTIDSGNLKNGEESEKSVEFTLPDGDLIGYELRIMTWDSMLTGNKLFKSLIVK